MRIFIFWSFVLSSINLPTIISSKSDQHDSHLSDFSVRLELHLVLHWLGDGPLDEGGLVRVLGNDGIVGVLDLVRFHRESLFEIAEAAHLVDFLLLGDDMMMMANWLNSDTRYGSCYVG